MMTTSEGAGGGPTYPQLGNNPLKKGPPPSSKRTGFFFVPKNVQCFETDFEFMSFFSRFLAFEIWSILYSTSVVNWGLERFFCEPDSEMLTNDTR